VPAPSARRARMTALRATARYVELRQQFTPQRLPGRGRLDAGCGLSS